MEWFKRKYLIALLCFLFTITSCFAEGWIKITDKKYAMIDTIETTNNNVYIYFWNKHLNDKSKVFTNFENLYKSKVWYSLDYTQVDCKNKKFYIQEIYVYDLKGNVLGSYSKHSQEFRITPDSYSDMVYLEACKQIINYKQ